MKRNWEGFNTSAEFAEVVRPILRFVGIKFETSGNGNAVHFEVFVDNDEFEVLYRDLLPMILDIKEFEDRAERGGEIIHV